MASRGSRGIPSDHMVVSSLGYVLVLLRRVRGCKNESTAELHRRDVVRGAGAVRFYTKTALLNLEHRQSQAWALC